MRYGNTERWRIHRERFLSALKEDIQLHNRCPQLRQLSKENKARLIELFDQGRNYREIGEALGITQNQARNQAIKLGIVKPILVKQY